MVALVVVVVDGVVVPLALDDDGVAVVHAEVRDDGTPVAGAVVVLVVRHEVPCASD